MRMGTPSICVNCLAGPAPGAAMRVPSPAAGMMTTTFIASSLHALTFRAKEPLYVLQLQRARVGWEALQEDASVLLVQDAIVKQRQHAAIMQRADETPKA